jgi:hypothetical protein
VGAVLLVVLLSRTGTCPPFSACDVTALTVVRDNGVADERKFYWARHSLQSWTLGSPLIKRGAAAGAQLPSAVELNPFPGAHGYAADQSVVFVDPHGLTDGFLARLRPETGEVFRAGHLPRQVPQGYLDSVERGVPHMLDQDLNKFYEKYLIVTRAPVFSWERLSILPAFVLGRYDHYLRSYEERPLTLPLKTFAVVPGGSTWNAPGTVEVPQRGILVTLEQPAEAGVALIQVDANDPVLVSFAVCSGGGDGGVTVIQDLDHHKVSTAKGEGIQPRLIRRQSRTPFNCIGIRNIGSDPLCSVAGIVLQ